MCRNCGAEQYQDEEGASSCKDCPQGYATNGAKGLAKCDKLTPESFLADVLIAILVFSAVIAVSRWVIRKTYAASDNNEPLHKEDGGGAGVATTSPKNTQVQVMPVRSPAAHRLRPKIDDKAQLRYKARAQVRRTQTLTRVPIFSMLSERSIDVILSATSHRAVEKGKVVCRQGESTYRFSIVVSGTFSVSVRDPNSPSDQQRRLGTLGEGDFFGEACLASSIRWMVRRKNRKKSGDGSTQPGEAGLEALRSLATITAETDASQLLSLSREDIDRLVRGGLLREEDIAAGAEAKRIAWREKLDHRQAELGVDAGPPQRMNTAVML
jgi:CRP-like cAMP-binding protein